MARPLSLSKHADGTITLRLGRLVAVVDSRGKSHDELIDAVRWAAISMNAPITPHAAASLLFPTPQHHTPHTTTT